MISILQISDIHLGNALNETRINIASKIAEAVIPYLETSKEVIVVVTGDIVFSGTQQEYVSASAFLEIIRVAMGSHGISANFWFAPGNHDCDFSGKSKMREILLTSVIGDAEDKVDDEIVKQLLSVQENYRIFSSKFDKTYFVNHLVNKYSFLGKEGNLFGYSFNSSWMSQIEEMQGTLKIPRSYLPDISDEGLRICFFHHPLNWFEPISARELNDFIKKNFDIVFTGHEHVSNTFSNSDHRNKLDTLYIEGDVLFGKAQDPSGFNFIQIDREEKVSNFYNLKFDAKTKIFRQGELSKVPFLRSKHQQLQKFQLSQFCKKWLDSMGYAFKHSQKETLYLSDVFVCPDFEEIKNQTRGKKSEQFSSDKFFDIHESESKLIIFGQKESGKTSLAKRIFFHHRDRDRVVLYIKGQDLSRNLLIDSVEILDKIKNLADNQYDQFDTDMFRQMSSSRKALIIDDFHETELNANGKQKLLSILSNYFDFIVAFEDEAYQYGELIADSKGALDAFKFISIKPFNKRLKNLLIKKWTYLGRENTLGIQESIKFQEHLFGVIEGILENKVILSFPIYILTLLQQLDSGTTAGAMSGSHGYLYHFLIQEELKNKFENGTTINSVENYLTHFCYWIFDEKIKTVSIEKFEEFHTKYVNDFGSTLKSDWILQNFQSKGIFSISNESISVSRKYYTSYFASKRFAELLINDSEGQYRNRMSEWIKKVYLESISSFFVCLFYHSSNLSIRDTVLSFANTIFSDLSPFDFDKDSSYLKELDFEYFDDLLEIDDDNVQKNREQLIESKDKMVQKHDFIEESDFDKDDPTDLSIQIHLSFKLLNLLGQMLKAHQGKVSRSDQKILSITCFDLGLRTLKFFSDFIQKNKEQIINESQSLFSKEKTKADNEKNAKKLIYLIMQAVSTGFVERIASSVGAEELKMIFKDTVAENGGIGYSMIDFSIKLTYQSQFPTNHAIELADTLEDNSFATDSLKLVVIKYLHFNLVDHRDKEKVAQKLGLKTSTLKRALLAAKK